MSERCCNPTCENIAELKKCALCREVGYCSKACQETAWKVGHKNECFGKKLPIILTAIEIALFGVDGGGSDVERLTRIESQLQDDTTAKKTDTTQEGIKSRLDNLLSASYISPIVAVPVQTGIQYAVFSPFSYQGCYNTLDKAIARLNQVATVLRTEQGSPFSSIGYYCKAALSGDLPILSWYEHSMIAIYLSHYNAVKSEGDELQRPYISGEKLVIPRDERPSGLYMLNSNDPSGRVFKT